MANTQEVNIKGLQAPAKVLAAAAHGAADMFGKYGGDLDSILGNAGIRANDLGDPVNELSLHDYCKMFEIAAQQTQNPHIGLHFGRSFQPQHLGMLGYAAISSPTMAAALRNMEELFPAHQDQSNFGLLQDDGILWLTYHILDPRIPNRKQDAELSLGMFCNIFRTALGQNWTPLEVRFEHSGPENPIEHQSTFGCPVAFGRRTNAICFRCSDLDASMPTHDSYLFSTVSAFLRQRLPQDRNLKDFASMLRNEVKMLLGASEPSIDNLANVMGLTSIRIQKQLRECGMTFNDVVRAAREELALHYIEDKNISLTEIAFNLGYSELSAFSRAFRKWTGMSPQRYRRKLSR